MKKDVVIYNQEVAEKCKYGPEFVKELLFTDGHHGIFVPTAEYAQSTRRIEGLERIKKCRAYYQQNPVRFIKDFFNIQLLDSQAWITTEAWNKAHVMILASRAYGKSFWVDQFTMAKQMLASFPFVAYIASGTAQQSANTFKKLEDIANDRVESLLNSTGSLFKDEVEVKNTSGDGFSHNPAGFEYTLYNGSLTRTLNSNVDKNRGARSSMVVYDETAFLDDELIAVYEAFTAVDKDFKTGVDDSGHNQDNVYLHTLPKEQPNQLIYVSSASSTDTDFYRKYREFSKKMLAGDPNYFVADIDCELVMKPTVMGKPIKPALTRDKIEALMATNPEKARREYFNEFTTDGGQDSIIRRGIITRNEEVRKPLLYNDTGDKKFIITYDPARSRDNSVILVEEVYVEKLPDGTPDIKSRLVNCINLLDVGKKIKSPMQTPDQIKYLKQVILDYNGNADAYGNILGIWIDAGSGGGGVNIADYLMPDWVDKSGVTHRGLIDKEYSKEYINRFPNAVDKVRLISPSAMKADIYEALIELVHQNKISFTAQYDGKGFLTVFDTDNEQMAKAKEAIANKLKKKKLSPDEYDAQMRTELSQIQSVKSRTIQLDWQDEMALTNMDALKEELVNMIRIKRSSGRDSFEQSPEKRNKMHDDRAYVTALAAYGLMVERRKNILKKASTHSSNDLLNSLTIRKGVRPSSY